MENSVVISAALTVVALVLAIFGASWLNQRALALQQQAIRDLLLQMEKRFDERFNTIEQRLSERFNAVEQRFVAVEQRLDRIERQLEAIFKPVLPSR